MGGKQSFAVTHQSDEVAPIAVVRRTTIEPPESTLRFVGRQSPRA
jgi:hypothetical protein